MMDYETTDVLNRVVWAPMPYTKHHVEVHESEVIPYPCSLPTNSANLTVMPFLMADVLTFSRNGDRQTNTPTQPIQPSNPTIKPTIQPSNHPTYHPMTYNPTPTTMDLWAQVTLSTSAGPKSSLPACNNENTNGTWHLGCWEIFADSLLEGII